jgi:hypothetical protein
MAVASQAGGLRRRGRRRHRRSDRGRPLHGDAGSHRESDRAPRRPPQARPAPRRRPDPGQALDADRLRTRRRRNRPSLHSGDAGRSGDRRAPARAHRAERAAVAQHSLPCRTAAGLLRPSPRASRPLRRGPHCTTVHYSEPTVQDPVVPSPVRTDCPASMTMTASHHASAASQLRGGACTMVDRPPPGVRERRRGRRAQAARKSVTCLVKALACWKRKAWPASP